LWLLLRPIALGGLCRNRLDLDQEIGACARGDLHSGGFTYSPRRTIVAQLAVDQ
jgi:hypothetical protein